MHTNHKHNHRNHRTNFNVTGSSVSQLSSFTIHSNQFHAEKHHGNDMSDTINNY